MLQLPDAIVKERAVPQVEMQISLLHLVELVKRANHHRAFSARRQFEPRDHILIGGTAKLFGQGFDFDLFSTSNHSRTSVLVGRSLRCVNNNMGCFDRVICELERDFDPDTQNARLCQRRATEGQSESLMCKQLKERRLPKYRRKNASTTISQIVEELT